MSFEIEREVFLCWGHLSIVFFPSPSNLFLFLFVPGADLCLNRPLLALDQERWTCAQHLNSKENLGNVFICPSFHSPSLKKSSCAGIDLRKILDLVSLTLFYLDTDSPLHLSTFSFSLFFPNSFNFFPFLILHTQKALCTRGIIYGRYELCPNRKKSGSNCPVGLCETFTAGRAKICERQEGSLV